MGWERALGFNECYRPKQELSLFERKSAKLASSRDLVPVKMKIKSITWGLAPLAAFAVVFGLVWVFVPSYVTSSRESREFSLRQDLLTLRSIISQYTLEKHQRPHSIRDLVAAGYLKRIPVDPMTGRDDTWVLKCSSDPATPGIESIESGYASVATRSIARCD